MTTTDDLLRTLIEKVDRLTAQVALLAAQKSGGSSSASKASGDGPRFPNYGRKKGEPVKGADIGDLKFYARGCERTLADEGKARWHDRERELLAAIHAEMRRQGHAPDYGDSQQDDGPPAF